VTLTFNGRVEALVTVPSSTTVSATNSGGGPTSVTLPAASYFPTAAGSVTSVITALQTALNATRTPANWTVSLSTTTGLVTINCTGTWSLAWTSANLKSYLGFPSDISSASSAQTGTRQCRGLWFPDSPLLLDTYPTRAPRVSDKREQMSPTGSLIALVGNTYRRHRNLLWSAVPADRAWEAEATYDHASWEWFVDETQLGQQLSWFTPASPIQIYDHAGNVVGSEANDGTGVDGWQIVGLDSIEPKRSFGSWAGRWRVELPEIVSSG